MSTTAAVRVPIRQTWLQARATGDVPEVERVSAQILQGAPDDDAVRRGLARLYVELGRRDEAELHWAALRQKNRADFEAAFHLASAEVENGRPVGAAVEAAAPAGTAAFRDNLRRVFDAPVANRNPDRSARHISICGVSFCGSTLMDRVLAGLPGVQSIGESHWLVKTRRDREFKTIMSFDTVEQPPHIVHCSGCGPSCEVLTYEFRRDLAADHTDWYFKIADRLGTGILISADKNPPKLVDNDPLMRFSALVMFKSPAQAWASKLSKLPQGQDAAFYKGECEKYTVVWTRTYRTFLDYLRPRGNVVFFFFDAFTQAPRENFESLCRAFDLPFTPDVLKQTRPGHAVGGNKGSMERLRSRDYGVEVEPLPEPDFPIEHRRILESHHEMQDTFAAMIEAQRRALSAPLGVGH
jgi:hypothetical protein